MKLISMTDFVLEIGKQTEIKTYEWYFLKVFDYAQFLKQPLTLDMFIGDKALFEGFEKEDWRITYKNNRVVDTLDLGDRWCVVEILLEYELTLTPYAIKLLGL